VEHRGFGSIAAGLSSSRGGVLTAEVDANFCRRAETFSSREFSLLAYNKEARQGKLGLALIRMCIWWTCQGFADWFRQSAAEEIPT
jgi:hypothetical protein